MQQLGFQKHNQKLKRALNKVRKVEFFLLFIILFGGLVLRLYKIDRPVADWHSWRQADTAAVSRNFIKEGFNPLVPKYDDMSKQANGLDNPQRYRFVEFPILNTIIAGVWLITGVNETYARLVTVFISLGSTALLFLVVRSLSGLPVAALSTFFFATIPYNVFYSSAILPGPLMIFGILGLYFCFVKWLEGEKWIFLISLIFFANLAILSWPVALFFLLPIVYLLYEKHGFAFFKNLKLWIFTFFSLTPFIAWRIWMLNFPEGIPSWQFLLNDGNIRFKGAFFRWLIAERIGKLILTIGGFSLFVAGLIVKNSKKENLFYLTWLFSLILYFIVFASGNVRHDYYQVPLVPIASIFMAIGTIKLFNLPGAYFSKLLGPAVALILIIFMYAFGFYEVRGYWWINKPEIVKAGMAADKILPKDAKVIAPYGGDTAFLYQTNRHGYPLVERSIQELIKNGAKYLISVDVADEGIQKLAKNCKLLAAENEYLIIELSENCID